MSTATLQPVTITTPPEQLRAAFVKISHTQVPSPLWHFEIAVPKDSRIAPAVKTVPEPGGPLISLALFNRPDPPCDLEVFGQHLPFEIDPADWLDAWIAQQPFKVLSRMRIATLGGAVGDVVVQWQAGPDAQFIGRLFATKAGPRLILIWFRTAEKHYAQLAESMFLSLTTFRMLDESPGPLAEQIRWIGAPLPLQWRSAIPVSWEIKEEPATSNAASFQATLLAPALPSQPQTILGKLSFAVIAAPQANLPAEILEKMLAAIRDTGATIQPAALMPEPAPPPYLQAWHGQTTATVNHNAAEIHCRILRHPQAWIAALIVTPPRATNAPLWMRNKRLLDIAIGTLEITY